MGDFFLGEIRMFGCAFAPTDWALCQGQLIQIQQNAALYALLGIQFGGDGRSNFNLPDLRGRAIIGAYTGNTLPSGVATRYVQGSTGGAESVTLTQATTPPHTHVVVAATKDGEAASPQNGIFANSTGTVPNYFTVSGAAPALKPLDPASLSVVGSATAHPNMQPFIAMNYCICTSGVFPQRPY